MSNTLRWLATVVILLPVLPLLAAPQQPPPAAVAQTQKPASAAAATDEGVPVTDAEVVKACGSCHVPDDKQRMTRISYRRATPENWELTIRRMMSLAASRAASSSHCPTRTAWLLKKRDRSCSTPSGV